MTENLLLGRNSVREALKAGRAIDKLLVQEGERQGSMGQILRLAQEAGVAVETVSAAHLNRLCQDLTHQGVAAFVATTIYSTLDDVLSLAAARQEPPLLVVLAELQDPRNVGAIIRTAAVAGAHGVLIPQKRACQITPAVARAAAGATEYIPLVRIGNISQTLKTLKARGLWIAGADPAGEDYRRAALDAPIALVIGGEDKGLGRLIRETCDFLVGIPMPGYALSLNASVAAALLIYEALRRRGGDG